MKNNLISENKIKTKIKFADLSKTKEDENARRIKNGTHKEFIIDGVKVVALNEKNAIKKAEKLKIQKD